MDDTYAVSKPELKLEVSLDFHYVNLGRTV